MSSYPDVKALTDEWVDVYATTGITVGNKLIVQNKSNTSILLFESVSKPLVDKEGRMVLPWTQCSKDTIVHQGSVGCWVKALDTESYISVQEG